MLFDFAFFADAFGESKLDPACKQVSLGRTNCRLPRWILEQSEIELFM
jgi:hypothetical protein